MYHFESRVRYSETDETGSLSITGIMNYLQDCSTFQSEDLKLGIEYLKNKKKAWWLNFWQILIERYPKMGERIVISTWPYDFKGIFAYRNFTICDEQGNYLVRADSSWFLYDLEKNCPVRVTEEEVRGYGVGDTPLDLPSVPRKIVLPNEYRMGEPITVSHHHMDTNLHVNNAQYVKIAKELLPEQFIISELRTEYKKAAVLGDTMKPRISRTKEGYVVSLQDEEENPFANIWMAGKERV